MPFLFFFSCCPVLVVYHKHYFWYPWYNRTCKAMTNAMDLHILSFCWNIACPIRSKRYIESGAGEQFSYSHILFYYSPISVLKFESRVTVPIKLKNTVRVTTKNGGVIKPSVLGINGSKKIMILVTIILKIMYIN